MSLSQVLLAILLLTCLTSFAWAMRNFFVQPEKLTVGLRITILAGAVFGFLHLVIILMTPKPANDLAVTSLALPLVAAAAVLYCLALAIFWSAIAANRVKPLSACFSTNEQLHLVQHGPYRFVRHPFYCSYLLTWLAGAVATLNVWLCFSFVIMFVLYLTAARKEENKFASSPLAEAYAEYRRNTGRFLPIPFKRIAGRRPQ